MARICSGEKATVRLLPLICTCFVRLICPGNPIRFANTPTTAKSCLKCTGRCCRKRMHDLRSSTERSRLDWRRQSQQLKNFPDLCGAVKSPGSRLCASYYGPNRQPIRILYLIGVSVALSLLQAEIIPIEPARVMPGRELRGVVASLRLRNPFASGCFTHFSSLCFLSTKHPERIAYWQ